MKSLLLFGNKGGGGTTTLTFNIAHMAARQGMRTIVLDYDPQYNLSSLFLSEERLAELWELWESGEAVGRTVAACLEPVRRGKGDVAAPVPMPVADDLWLLPGHLGLSRFEQTLAEEWPKTCASDNERALAVTTALAALSDQAAAVVGANLVLLDVGPSLGALNRAALLACDAVAFPIVPDLFGLQGLKNAGPTLREWRRDWHAVYERQAQSCPQRRLPSHDFQPIGYIVQQHRVLSNRPVAGYARWAAQIPRAFHEAVLGETGSATDGFEPDPQCIGRLKHFASLVPIAQIARKPLFDLKVADGIGGGQIQSVAKSRQEFERLVQAIAKRLDLAIGEATEVG